MSDHFFILSIRLRLSEEIAQDSSFPLLGLIHDGIVSHVFPTYIEKLLTMIMGCESNEPLGQ